MKLCFNCQSPNPDGANFCSNCGHPVASASTMVQDISAEASSAETSPAPKSASLGKFIPEALLSKLEATRNYGGLPSDSALAERRFFWQSCTRCIQRWLESLLLSDNFLTKVRLEVFID